MPMQTDARYRNVRDGSRPAIALAVHEMTKSCLVKWGALALTANVQAWAALSNMVDEVVGSVAGARPRILSRAT